MPDLQAPDMNWAIVIAGILLFAFLEGIYAETEAKGAHLANVLAHCLNGGAIQHEDRVVICKVRR